MIGHQLTAHEIRERVDALGPWFHNLDLDGIATAPEHFLGDYPAVKWRRFCHAIDLDLSGRTVLDIGCNAGFYSHRNETARRHTRAGHRLRRGLHRPGSVRRRGQGLRHRVPASSQFTTSARWASALTSCCSWAFSITCAIRCSRSISSMSTSPTTCSCSSRCSGEARRWTASRENYGFWEDGNASTAAGFPKLHFHRTTAMPTILPTGGFPTAACVGSDAAQRRVSTLSGTRKPKFISAAEVARARAAPSILRKVARDDRSRHDLERAQQQIALGS